MPRPPTTQTRRGQIVEGLRTVMARTGYDRASVAALARAAGLAPGLVHYHFKSKLDILLALLDDLGRRHLDAVDARLAAAGPDPARRLAAFLDLHLATGREADPRALACWVVAGAEALRDARVRRRYARIVGALRDRLHAVLAEGRAGGAFTAGDPAAATAALLAAIEGYYVLAAIDRDLVPRATAAASVAAMAEGLLRPPVRPRRIPPEA